MLGVTTPQPTVTLTWTDADWSLVDLISLHQQHSSVLWFVSDHHTVALAALQESSQTVCTNSPDNFKGFCVSSSVIRLPFLKALSEFHRLIWLFKFSLAGRTLLWANGWLCSTWPSIEATFLFRPLWNLPFILCHFWFVGVSSPTSIFWRLVLSTREVYMYYVVYSRYFAFSFTGSAASGVVLPSLQITF